MVYGRVTLMSMEIGKQNGRYYIKRTQHLKKQHFGMCARSTFPNIYVSIVIRGHL